MSVGDWKAVESSRPWVFRVLASKVGGMEHPALAQIRPMPLLLVGNPILAAPQLL